MDQSSKIVLLFDYFSMESRNLYESFTNVGIPFTAAVVEDDGFLPEGVNSVYGYFCTQGAVAREEHPDILIRSRCRNTGGSKVQIPVER